MIVVDLEVERVTVITAEYDIGDLECGRQAGAQSVSITWKHDMIIAETLERD